MADPTREHAAARRRRIGDELFDTLEILQERYEDMVRERSTRDDAASQNLRVLRHGLQRLIQRYAGAVVGMLDEDDADSGAVVVDALQPIVNARVRRARAAGSSGEGEGQGEGAAEATGDADGPSTGAADEQA